MEAKAYQIHHDLIERARVNDQKAQFDLYKKYNAAMYNVALNITGNSATAEDAVQESFINAFKSIDFYRGDSSFGGWLKRIVINKSLTLAKRESNWTLVDELPDKESEEQLSLQDDDYNIELVKMAIEKLPNGFRTVLTLYLIEGYDHKEIGEILNISESTSKSQYKRAKDKLKELIGHLRN